MRTIKFRAWAKNAKTMHPIWLSTDDEGGRYVLMQYTEHKDRNDKEIYDGDVLLYQKIYRGKDIKHYHEVYWDRTGQWRIRGINVECTHRMHEVAYSHEVVGNIYENKNFLTKKHEKL